MIKELVIHLGDTKTGSTSIQNALLQNACQQAGATIVYPTKNHHNAVVRTLTRPSQANERELRFSRIRTLLMESEADIGVVSAEHFQFVDPDQLIETMDLYWPEFRDRIRLIAYVRPHAEKLLSSFAERTKLGHLRGSVEDFVDRTLRKETLDYQPRFAKWRDRFGDRFELRPFVRDEMFRGDPVADFFRFVLNHDAFHIGEVISSNISPSLGQLALLREMHGELSARVAARGRKVTRALTDARATMGRTVAEHIRDQGLGNDTGKPGLPAHLETQIRARYGDDAAALDEMFFDATPMSDALAGMSRLTVGTAQQLEASPDFSREVTAGVRAFGAVLSEMLLNDPKLFIKQANNARLMFTRSPRI